MTFLNNYMFMMIIYVRYFILGLHLMGWQGSHIYWKTWKNESTPGKPGKNHGILQKIIKIMEKLHGTWKNIWVDYKSLHAKGRPQVLCVCLLSGGWNKCSILCMHWNGPRVNSNCQTCVHIAHLQRGKAGSSVWPERSVRGLWGRPPCVPPLQQGGHPLVVEGDK